MKNILAYLLITGAALSVCTADVGVRKKEVVRERTKSEYTFKSPMLFADEETTFDIFGLYAATEGAGRYDDGFGGGLGVNRFFKRYFGLGLEGYFWDGDRGPSGNESDVISSVAGSLIARYPIDQYHIAPYLLAGLGGSFSSVDQFNLLAGGGFEFRFTPRVAFFSDGRYVWADQTNNYGLIRAGLRFPF
jgi:hypothetical protein